MTHPRRLIREAVAAAISAAATPLGNRVWASREAPVDVETVLMGEGPVCLIYTRRDRLAKDGSSNAGFGFEQRECDLVVELTAAGALIVEDKIDDLAEVVEEIMDRVTVPGMPTCEIRFVEAEIQTTTAFEQPIGSVEITYSARYWRQWRVEQEEDFPCPTDIGFKVNGGPRERIDPLPCECEP